jgi:hypothetical protein
LRIAGLEKGNYLFKIDGAEVGSFTSRNFEAGVDLSDVSRAPQRRRAEEIARGDGGKFEAGWRRYELVKDNKSPTADVPNSPNLTEARFASAFLGEEAVLTILAPPVAEGKTAAKPGAILFILPGSCGKTEGMRALSVLESTGLHARHNLLCVMPRFDKTPWCANHADDPKIRHERHILEEVIPFVEKTYFNGEKAPRFLIGFSKAGWGVLSLIFRNPAVFEKAAAWDAPVLLRDEDFGSWGSRENMGTAEVFHAFHPKLLCEKNAAHFRDRTRIVWGGADIFGMHGSAKYRNPDHTGGFHALMEKHGVRHVYFPELNMRHSWNPDWFAPMIEAMMAE